MNSNIMTADELKSALKEEFFALKSKKEELRKLSIEELWKVYAEDTKMFFDVILYDNVLYDADDAVLYAEDIAELISKLSMALATFTQETYGQNDYAFGIKAYIETDNEGKVHVIVKGKNLKYDTQLMEMAYNSVIRNTPFKDMPFHCVTRYLTTGELSNCKDDGGAKNPNGRVLLDILFE